MKQVSTAYSESMKSPLRNQSHAEIIFSQVDTTAATDGNWASNGALDYSEFDTLDYDYDYSETYATLELNRWGLDGNTVIVPNSGPYHDGFISNFMSNSTGQFSTYAVLTRTFTEAHAFIGITLIFDTRCQEWPNEVTVTFYVGDTIQKTVTASPTAPEVVIDAKVEACDKLEIRIGNTLLYRRPRLQQVLYGIRKRFGNNDIVSTEQSHDVDPLSRRLPQETMQFILLDYDHIYDPDNPQGIYAYLDEKAPIAIRFGYTLPSGKIEWLKSDKYVLNSKPQVSKNQATFTGTGLIGSLSGTFYKSKLGNKNLYDMAEEVLLDAGLSLTAQGTNPWDIDTSLKQMYTTAVLPIDSHMNCLQLIAHAGCCRLFTDDDNIIHISPFDPSNHIRTGDFRLDFTTISEDSQSISKIDQLKAVSVSKYAYIAGNDTTTLFEGTTTDTKLHVEFSGLAQDINVSISGGTLISSSIYARAADLVLSSGTKTVTITGKTLSENSVVVSYPVNSEGEIDKEENPLITNDEMCTALANHVKNYLQLRNTYDADYRGNPELEVGDIIGLQTLYTNEMDALVLVDEITFNGSLSGKLKVKGLI